MGNPYSAIHNLFPPAHIPSTLFKSFLPTANGQPSFLSPRISRLPGLPACLLPAWRRTGRQGFRRALDGNYHEFHTNKNDVAFRVQDLGYINAESRMQNAECRKQNAESGEHKAGYWILFTTLKNLPYSPIQ